MTTFFPTGTQTKTIQALDINLYNEIDTIQRSILTNAEIQIYEAVINTSPMTLYTPPVNQILTGDSVNSYLYSANHGLVKFDVLELQTTGILPGPLQAGYLYYVNPIDVNNFQIFTKKENVLANKFVTLYNNGTGIHNFVKIQSSQLYYLVYTNQLTDQNLTDKMNKVIQYFTDLGYTIGRRANNTTQTFYWYLQW